jgi:hypothetical protein
LFCLIPLWLNMPKCLVAALDLPDTQIGSSSAAKWLLS